MSIATTKVEPLIGGCAIAKHGTPENYGTLGMIVYRHGQPMALTCEHVVGSHREAAYEVRHPPKGEESRTIGTVYFSDKNSLVDVALVHLRDDVDYRTGIAGLGIDYKAFEFGNVADKDIGSTVYQIGASTGFSPIPVGNIHHVSATIDAPDRDVTFVGQIIAVPTGSTPIIAPGDSGSILLRQKGDKYQCLGVVHSQTVEGYLVACHIRWALPDLVVEIQPPPWSPHF